MPIIKPLQNNSTMNTATDITEQFTTLYYPQSALVFYTLQEGSRTDTYVEYFDVDDNGKFVNAHPLTVQEAQTFAQSLNTKSEAQQAFLTPKGILPAHVLHIKPSENGSVIWHSKAQERQLYFKEHLDIPNGKAFVPPMLWYATQNSLSVFALASNRRPTEKTALYHAPFFNVYDNGNVCMGTVDVHTKQPASLEAFIAAWEHYFFNSYFSHLIGSNPINGNCVNLWKDLVNSGKTFPENVLKKTRQTLKNLLP
jgi:PRTRC genetic system protein B